MPDINIFVPLNINVNPQVANVVGTQVGVSVFGNVNQTQGQGASNSNTTVQLNRWN